MKIKFMDGTVKEIEKLRGANLHHANLHHADLHGADLRGADLRVANLQGANLQGVDLRGANLECANLECADLRDANLHHADLWNADLRVANLQGANLQGANLECANLECANLECADLRDANLPDWELKLLVSTRTIVGSGTLQVFKKLANGSICELEIPPDARRVGGVTGRKCRAEYAKVLYGSGVSKFSSTFSYVAGEVVRAENFDPNPLIECAGGIHFFITREEAEAY